MYVRKTIIGLILSAITLTVNASNVATAYFTISKIRLSTTTGRAYIDPAGGTESKNSSCSQQGLYAFHSDDPMFDRLYSTVLAAASASKPIKVWISTEPDDCLAGFQRITIIEVDF